MGHKLSNTKTMGLQRQKDVRFSVCLLVCQKNLTLHNKVTGHQFRNIKFQRKKKKRKKKQRTLAFALGARGLPLGDT